ncbi:hypothetical protein [Nonomuraea sp. SYSU D8015]|uniref:hypothetical protein n=1 Tax=Nonomuraea sp. SYSU D8015 TaxID=2593644 RepID=UPI00166019F8|nr:hypothetical protein [Nonomuraea sp. SYSU D8015]
MNHHGQPPPHPHGPRFPGPAPVSQARNWAGFLGLTIGVIAVIAAFLWVKPNLVPLGLGLLAIVLSAFRLSRARVGGEKYRDAARAGMTLGLVAVGCVILVPLLAGFAADILNR